jgi:hypothetical protein
MYEFSGFYNFSKVLRQLSVRSLEFLLAVLGWPPLSWYPAGSNDRYGQPQVTMQTQDHWYFSLVKRSARSQSAAENGSEIVFRPCWQMRAVALLIVAGYGLVLFGLLISRPNPGDPWYLKPTLLSIFSALPVAILLALRGRVVINSSGIRQRFWWRPEKRIPWSEFASVIHDRNDGSTIVYGKFESPTTFSSYLADQSRFDHEVKVFSHTDEIRDDL